MGIMRFIFIYIFSFVLYTVAVAQKQQYHISLILPFNNKLSLTAQGTSAVQLGDMCRQYYQGMLIAFDEIATEDRAIHLHVFDTENDSMQTVKIIQKPTFKQSDLIFGPVMQGGNKLVSDFARQSKVFQVSPLMTFSKSKIGDEYWISANPDLPSYGSIIAQQLLQAHPNDSLHIIIVSDNGSLDKAISPTLKKALQDYKRAKVKVVESTASADINAVLHTTKYNYVIIPTNKEQVANQVLYRIKDTTQAQNITVLGFAQWFDFKTIDPSIWQRKNVSIVSPYFVDYTDANVISFVEKYRERYATEPTEEAVKGYDQAKYFGLQLLKNGRSLFSNNIENTSYKALHTRYQFEKDKVSGQYKNGYLNIIRFSGNELKVR
jgi:ABC-type branched-subunit amino acid transport system substrate-binding protein